MAIRPASVMAAFSALPPTGVGAVVDLLVGVVVRVRVLVQVVVGEGPASKTE